MVVLIKKLFNVIIFYYIMEVKMKKILSKISFSRLLFSIVFAFSLFYMSKIVFLGYVYY